MTRVHRHIVYDASRKSIRLLILIHALIHHTIDNQKKIFTQITFFFMEQNRAEHLSYDLGLLALVFQSQVLSIDLVLAFSSFFPPMCAKFVNITPIVIIL